MRLTRRYRPKDDVTQSGIHARLGCLGLSPFIDKDKGQSAAASSKDTDDRFGRF